jgi:hypothetical protein
VPNVGIFIFVMMALLFIVLIIYSVISSRRRRKELSVWADANGLVFAAGPNRELDADYPAFKCLHTGSSRCGYNLMGGKWSGRDFRAFDYRYTVGSGKNQSTVVFSAIVLENQAPLKPLLIRTENLFDHVAEFFGAEGIKFESAEFNRAFHVTSPDRKWAYDVLHPRAMEFLLSMPKFEVQFDDVLVMVHRARTFSVQDFEAAAKVAQGLLDGLPEFVKEEEQAHAQAGETECPR